MLKNSIKVLLSNLGLIWKSLLYKLTSLIISLGLSSCLFVPIITNLAKGGFFGELNKTFNDLVFNVKLDSLYYGIKNLVIKFWNIVSSNNQIALLIIGLILFLVIYYFLNGLLKNAVTGSIVTYMSSYAKTTFFGNYLSGLKRSSLLSLIRVAVGVPINIIIITISTLILINMESTISLGIFLTLAFAIVSISIKNTLLAGYETAVYIHNYSLLECLKKSTKILKSKFMRIFSDNIFITLFIFVLDFIMLIFTVGGGLLITIPATLVFSASYNSVVYFDTNGMRYYLDSNNIFTPKKLEEKDSFKKVKDII